MWNCDGKAKDPPRIPVAKGLSALFVRRCPMALLKETPSVAWLWEEYQTWACFKMLTNSGGLGEQEAKIIKAIEFITLEINRLENNKAYSKWRSSKSGENQNQDTDKQINSFRDIQQQRNQR